jgi:hypothetical protein
MKFWPTKEKEYPKRGIDYDYVDNEEQKITSIKIVKGDYRGIIYHYGQVQVDKSIFPKLKFDYYISESGDFDVKKLHKDKKFITLMGDILVSVFDENVLKKEIKKDESS